MTNKQITSRELKAILAYDPLSGVFTWAIDRNRVKAGKRAGSISSGRRYVMINKKMYFEHRLAWLYVYGKFPDGVIDHIDGNPLNNAIANLRDVSVSVNQQNLKKAKANSTSGLLGAIYDSFTGKYIARIKANGKSINLGRFSSPDDAHEAYLKAKRKLHHGCTI